MTTLLNILREIESGVRAKMLTCDAEIVWFLYFNGQETAGNMFKTSKHSSTAFYSTLKRLADTGVIASQVNPADKRSNVYVLSAVVRELIDRCFNQGAAASQGACAA